MSLGNLLHLSYWITPPFPAYHAVRVVWLVAFGLVTAVGFVALLIRTRKLDTTMHRVCGRIALTGISMGLLGFLLFSFRQEGIALFSWRVWPLVWCIVLVVLSVKIVRYIVGRVPQIKTENMARAMKERYLPKSSK